MKIPVALLVVSFVAILAASAGADPAENLVVNGDFKLQDLDGHPTGWSLSPGADKIIKVIDENDQQYLRMNCPAGTKKEFAAWRTIALKPDWLWLRVSADMCAYGAADFRKKNPKSGYLGGMRVKFMDRNNKPTGWYVMPAPEEEGLTPPVPVDETIEIPDNTVTANVECILASGSTNVEVEVGDIEATPLTAADRASVKKPISLSLALRLKDYRAAEYMAKAAIIAHADDTAQVQRLQKIRVQALLQMNKPQEALQAAKGLYGVCTMGETADAVNVVVECLKAAYPNDPDRANRFFDEQTTDPNADKSQAATVLSGVEIAADADYEEAIQRALQQSFEGLTARGNLLILAGRAKEAEEPLKQAGRIAPDKKVAAGVEGQARCMKAEDGTFARANAWIVSLRNSGK